MAKAVCTKMNINIVREYGSELRIYAFRSTLTTPKVDVISESGDLELE